MTRVTADISISADGYVAGPDPTLEEPLGAGGEQLHEWAFRLAAWREPHGLAGGEAGGAGKLSGGAPGRWEPAPTAAGWWGEGPPFHAPVFVVTRHPREPL